MQNLLAVSAMGLNRPGLVESLVKGFRECGCSIAESRMAVLGDRFTMSVLLSGTWDAIAKIETLLSRLAKDQDVAVLAQRATTREPSHNLVPYAVEVVAVDQVGIVHQIAQFFGRREINVEDMYTGTYAAAHTGTPMFSLHMTISIPTDISIAAMRSEFMDFCDQLNLDAIMEPVK
ncbi:MAG: glycine cleavage system protein R [Gammaproteobacteria bacterium]